MAMQDPNNQSWWSQYKTLDDAYQAGPDVYKNVLDTYKALSRADVDDELIRGTASRLGYAPVAQNQDGQLEDLSDMIKSRSAATGMELTQDYAATLARGFAGLPADLANFAGSLTRPLGYEAPLQFGTAWQEGVNSFIPTSNEYRETFAKEVGAATATTLQSFAGGAGLAKGLVKVAPRLGAVGRLGLVGKELAAAEQLASATKALSAARSATSPVLADIAKAQEVLSQAQSAYRGARAANIARASTYTGMAIEAGATGKEAYQKGADPYTQLFASALGAVAGSTELIAGERLLRKIIDPGNLGKYRDVAKGIGQQVGGEIVEEEIAAVPSALAQYLTEDQGRSFSELLQENMIQSAKVTPFAVLPFSAVYGVRASQMVRRNKQFVREVENVTKNAGAFVDPNVPLGLKLDVVEKRLPEIAAANDLETLAEMVGLSKMMGAPVHLSSAATERVKTIAERLAARGLRVVFVQPTVDKDGNFDTTDIAGIDPSFAPRPDMAPGDVAGYYDPASATVYINTAQPEAVQIMQGLVHETVHDLGETHPGGIAGVANMLDQVFPGAFQNYMAAVAKMYAKDWAKLTPEQQQYALNSEGVATFVSQGLAGFMGMAMTNREMLSRIGYQDPGIMFDLAQSVLSVLRIQPQSFTQREQAILSSRLASLARVVAPTVSFEGDKGADVDGIMGARVASELYRLLNEHLDLTGRTVDVAVNMPEGGDLQTELQSVMGLNPEEAARVAQDVARREKIVNILKERRGLGKPVPKETETKAEEVPPPSTSSTTGAPPEEKAKPTDPTTVNAEENAKLAQRLEPFIESLKEEQRQNQASGTTDQQLDDLIALSEDLLNTVTQDETADQAGFEQDFQELQGMRPARAAAPTAPTTSAAPEAGSTEPTWKRRQRERAARRNAANRAKNEARRAQAAPVEAVEPEATVEAAEPTAPVEATTKPSEPTKPGKEQQGTLPGFFSARITAEALEKAVAEGSIKVGTKKLTVWNQWQQFAQRFNDTLQKLNYAEFRAVGEWNKLPEARKKAIIKRNLKAIKAAADQAAQDILPWIKNNRALQGYYADDLKLVNMLWEQIYGDKFTQDHLDLFQVVSAVLSPSTKLRGNIDEASRVLTNYMSTGDFGVETDPYTFVNEKGTETLKFRFSVARSAVSISGTTASNKARSLTILRDMIEDAGGLEKLKAHLLEPVSLKEYADLRSRHGFKGLGSLASIRQVVGAATGQKIGTGKNDTMMYPRAMMFGPKVGAYLLNSLGDSRYQTVDIWESRFIRSYFDKIMFIRDEQTKERKRLRELPTGPEYKLMNMFAAEMKRSLEELSGEKFTASSMQALRWFYMLELARRAGNTLATTDGTVSGYLDAALSKYYGPDYRSSGRGLPQESQVSATETEAERIAGEERITAEQAVEEQDTELSYEAPSERQVDGVNSTQGFYSRRVAVVSPIGFFDNLDKAISSAPDSFETESTPDREVPGRVVDIGGGKTKEIPGRTIKGSKTTAWSKLIAHLSKTPGALKQAVEVGMVRDVNGQYETGPGLRMYFESQKLDPNLGSAQEIDMTDIDSFWNTTVLGVQGGAKAVTAQSLERATTEVIRPDPVKAAALQKEADDAKQESKSAYRESRLDSFSGVARQNEFEMSFPPGLRADMLSTIESVAKILNDLGAQDARGLERFIDPRELKLQSIVNDAVLLYERLDQDSSSGKLEDFFVKAFRKGYTKDKTGSVARFMDQYNGLNPGSKQAMRSLLFRAALSPRPDIYLSFVKNSAEAIDGVVDALKALNEAQLALFGKGLAIYGETADQGGLQAFVEALPDGGNRVVFTGKNSNQQSQKSVDLDFQQTKEQMNAWAINPQVAGVLYKPYTLTGESAKGELGGSPNQSPSLHAYRMIQAMYAAGFYQSFSDRVFLVGNATGPGVYTGGNFSLHGIGDAMVENSLVKSRFAFIEQSERPSAYDFRDMASAYTIGSVQRTGIDFAFNLGQGLRLKTSYDQDSVSDTIVDAFALGDVPTYSAGKSFEKGFNSDLYEKLAKFQLEADKLKTSNDAPSQALGQALDNLVSKLSYVHAQGSFAGTDAGMALLARFAAYQKDHASVTEKAADKYNNAIGKIQALKRTNDVSYSEYSMTGEVLDYQEVHLTLSQQNSTKKWFDGHPKFHYAKNPVVRLRFTVRRVYDGAAASSADAGRVLFIEEIQSPQSIPTEYSGLKNRAESLAFRYALNYAAAQGYDYVSITRPEDQATRYWGESSVIRTEPDDYVLYQFENDNGVRTNKITFFDGAGNVLRTSVWDQNQDSSEAIASLDPRIAKILREQIKANKNSVIDSTKSAYELEAYDINADGKYSSIMGGAVHKTALSSNLYNRYVGALDQMAREMSGITDKVKTERKFINVEGLSSQWKPSSRVGQLGIQTGTSRLVDVSKAPAQQLAMPRQAAPVETDQTPYVPYEMIDISGIGDKITKTGFGFYGRRLDLANEMFVDDINLLRRMEDQIAANARTYQDAVAEADEVERRTGVRPAVTTPVAFYNPRTMNFGQMSDLYKGRIGYYNRLAMEQRQRIYDALGTGVPLSAADRSASQTVSAEEYLYATHAQEANLYLWLERSEMMFNETAAGQRARTDVINAENAYNTLLGTPGASPAAIAAAQNNLSAMIAVRESLLTAYRGTLAASNPELLSMSGMTDADARRILNAAVSEPYYAQLRDIRDAVTQIQDLKLQIMQVGGLISNQTAQDWASRYKNYIPLKTTIREPDGAYGAGTGFSIGGAETRRRRGRMSVADDILGHTLVDFSHANSRAMRNTAAQTMLRLIAANPNNPTFTFYGPGDVNRRRIPTRDDNRVISAKFNGEEHYAVINDAKLVEQFKKMGHIDLGNAAAGVVMATRVFSQMQTAWNPSFILPNFARDFMLATGLMYTDNGVRSAARLVRNIVPAIRTVLAAELGRTRAGQTRLGGGLVSRLGSGRFAAELAEMEQLGTFVAYTDYQSVEEYMAAMRTLSEAMRYSVGRRAIQAGESYVRPVLELVTASNAIAERATRLAAYVEYRQQGLSRVQAAAGAKNLTVNFDRKGTAGTALNGLYAFYNPNVQGTANLLRRLGPNARPEQRRRLMSLIGILAAYGFSQGLLNRAIAGDDDEGENAYRGKMQEADEKSRNTVMVLIPDGDGESIDIPLPWGLNVAFYAGSIMERFMADDITAMEAINNLSGAFVGSFSPIQGSTLAQAAVPTVAKPFAEIELNMKWNGQNVMPPVDPYDRTPMPDSHRHFATVGAIPKWVSYTLNEVTGGTERTPGAIDISPETIEHMAEFMTGGVGRFWTSALGWSWFNREPEKRTFKDLPLGIGAVGGRFYTQPDKERRTQSEYFDNMKKMALLKEDYQDTRTRQDALKDPTIRLIGAAKDFESIVRKLRQAEKDQLAAGNDERAKAMAKLRVEKMQKFNQLYNAAIKKAESK